MLGFTFFKLENHSLTPPNCKFRVTMITTPSFQESVGKIHLISNPFMADKAILT